MYIFMIWFCPRVPSARKAIITFIYSKHDALRSMKQGSWITEATLTEIGEMLMVFYSKTKTRQALPFYAFILSSLVNLLTFTFYSLSFSQSIVFKT